jgi:hypothetical protein
MASGLTRGARQKLEGTTMKLARRCVACAHERLNHAPAVLMPFVAHRAFGWTPTRINAEWGLRDLESGMAYALCRTTHCAQCGMLFLDMRFDDDELASLYDDYRGAAYSEQRDRFEPGYSQRNAILLGGSHYAARLEALLEPYVPARPRVLDWGGDNGVNTPFRGKAAQHDIFDISNRPPLDGARIVTLEEAKASVYDLFVCANVLEHVPQPGDMLRDIAALMAPGSVLYLEVPHEDAIRLHSTPEARLAHKRHWHEHINFFTQAALEALLDTAGLHVVTLLSHEVSAGGKDSFVFSIVAGRA